MSAKKGPQKVTSPKVATTASNILRDSKAPVAVKKVAGSAVSQARGSSSKRKG